jgi:hypothetical protein
MEPPLTIPPLESGTAELVEITKILRGSNTRDAQAKVRPEFPNSQIPVTQVFSEQAAG